MNVFDCSIIELPKFEDAAGNGKGSGRCGKRHLLCHRRRRCCEGHGQRQAPAYRVDHPAGGSGPRGRGNASGPGDLRRKRGHAPGRGRHGEQHAEPYRRTEHPRLRPVKPKTQGFPQRLMRCGNCFDSKKAFRPYCLSY